MVFKSCIAVETNPDLVGRNTGRQFEFGGAEIPVAGSDFFDFQSNGSIARTIGRHREPNRFIRHVAQHYAIGIVNLLSGSKREGEIGVVSSSAGSKTLPLLATEALLPV